MGIGAAFQKKRELLMSRSEDVFDVVIIGGGIIGLQTAYELTHRGLKAALLDRKKIGREASWAGAGILSPGATGPLESLRGSERLRAASFRRFPQLAERILEETGIDVGFRRTGGIEIARDSDATAKLAACREIRQGLGINVMDASGEFLADLEPGLSWVSEADWMADFCQVRNPRLLAGLLEACRQRGVTILEDQAGWSLEKLGDRGAAVVLCPRRRLVCGQVVVAAGAWSNNVLKGIEGIEIPIVPVQGQMVVFETRDREVRHIVCEGKRYLVPRDDGLVLVGATEENVGFQKQVTSEALSELRAFATGLFPRLAQCPVRYSWAGLRPASPLGHPILGRVGNLVNVWLAAGHFRQGIQQSSATAELLADWITGTPTFAREEEFSLTAPATVATAFDS